MPTCSEAKETSCQRAVGFVDGNGATGESHNDVNSKDQDTHEASRSVKSGPNGKAKNSSSDLSKALPQIFQVLRRDGPVDSGEETPESPAASGGGQSGSLPILTGSAGDDVHQLRKDPPGEVVQSHVEPGTSLGALVHPTLQQEPQARTSDLSSLREPQGGALRDDGRSHACDKCLLPTGDCSFEHHDVAQGEDDAEGQAPSDSTGRDECHSVGSRRREPGSFRSDSRRASSSPREDIVHLESRMLNMENALERVIQFIEQQSHQHAAEQ